jgi:CDP-diacylglycerol--glycerol-3-phosphate 3-phosphatidyltransferase
MKTLYDLKPRFQNLLKPLCRRLIQWHITANQVTIFASFLSIITGIFLALNISTSHVFLILPPILLIRMALNAIDGMLAREYAQKTPLGAILNELGDVISDSALYLPFILIPTVSPLLIILLVLLAVITEMTGVIAIQIGASRRYDGPMGKSDRAFVFGIIALLLGCNVPIEIALNTLFLIIDLLLMITIINRCYQALKQVNSTL